MKDPDSLVIKSLGLLERKQKEVVSSETEKDWKEIFSIIEESVKQEKFIDKDFFLEETYSDLIKMKTFEEMILMRIETIILKAYGLNLRKKNEEISNKLKIFQVTLEKFSNKLLQGNSKGYLKKLEEKLAKEEKELKKLLDVTQKLEKEKSLFLATISLEKG
ncbi:hypothetical protein CVU82_01735 [Candidatus Falkowbacteria bacterium HGW-Falkowbacteria-1]|jgi:hypothetical protein|uniref:Uncharacterized protein n=1 Tax=Candidatus Falkowbacteria bacterium HGW-Falkowbacteria-1 TaxID=2013768 RepID=A0A2N2E994_9BACT|nr:MAG: hypothetical protein CVU82_01735 [Candidatus Falkowbacteria bacterium HGW-Falkowbacteria-1]